MTIQLKPSIRPICLWGWSNACMGLNPPSTTPSHPIPLAVFHLPLNVVSSSRRRPPATSASRTPLPRYRIAGFVAGSQMKRRKSPSGIGSARPAKGSLDLLWLNNTSRPGLGSTSPATKKETTGQINNARGRYLQDCFPRGAFCEKLQLRLVSAFSSKFPGLFGGLDFVVAGRPTCSC